MNTFRQAFTLIELLIVIALIAIISGIGITSYSGLQQRGRDAQRVNDLNQIKIALNTYYNAQNPAAYVAAASKITIDGSSDALSSALEPNYIKDMPVDPNNSGNLVYKYQSFNNAANFTLYATFENQNNKKGWGGGSAWVVDGYQISDN